MHTLLYTHQFNKLLCIYDVQQGGKTASPQVNMWPTMLTTVSVLKQRHLWQIIVCMTRLLDFTA